MSTPKIYSHLRFFDGLLINAFIFAGIIYCITIYRYSFNQPVGDDYDAILLFLNQYVVAQPFEQLQLIFLQHNEHRILLTRLASVIDLKLFGHINFTHLIWLGNLGWSIAIAGFWHFAKKYQISITEFAPVAIALLSFSHFEMMTWAMTSISQYWQVCFGILAIGFMVNNRHKSALFFYVAAIFTSGGGIILVPILNAYYLLQKKWHEFSITVFLTLTILSVYFLLLPYRSPPSSRILDALMQPQLILSYFVGFTGGLGNNIDTGIITILVTGGILCVLFFLRFKYMYKSTPFLWWVAIYVCLTAILTALNRSFLGIASSGDSRYSEYSLLFYACIYLAYLLSASSKIARNKIVWIGFIFSIILFSYWHEQSKRPLIDRHHWLVNDIQTHPNWPEAQRIKARSIELGIMKK